jgi:hypothetical protein
MNTATDLLSAVTDLWELSAREKDLIKAAEHDSEANLHKKNGQRSLIRAEVLRDLCTGARRVKEDIRMTGGRVRGHLDLSGAQLVHALRFTDCVFEDSVILRQARAEHPIEWVGGCTAAIDADEFESAADLVIQGVTVTGSISLHWASIQGDLRMSGSQLTPSNGQALNGADLRVGGTLFLDGLDGKHFRAKGEVCLRSAHIHGQLDCRHAHFYNPSGYSINARYLELDGELLGDQGFHAKGEVCLERAQVQQVRVTGGRFASSTRYALHLDALRATGGVYLDRGFHATGAVRAVGANIAGELNCTHGTFHNPSGRALDAKRINVDDVYLDHGFTARGEVRFTGAQVGRQFHAKDGKFRNDRANGYALNADGLNCHGDVFLNDGFRATGEVRLIGAKIEGEFNCTDGSFTNPDGYALFADGLTTGMIYLDGKFRALGQVRLARATVDRQLVCTSGVFDNQHGVALDLTGLISPGDVLLNDGFRASGEISMRGAQITRDLNFKGAQLHGTEGLDARGLRVEGCLTWIMDRPPEGPVDLSFAHVSRLDDTAASWPPGNYTLADLTYWTATDGACTPDQRIKWLGNTSAYSAEPYQQLAHAYRLNGNEQAAQKIATASQRDLRKRGGLRWYSKAWNWFLDRSVGYGYCLHRPFLAVLILGLVGGCIYLWGERAGVIFATDPSSNTVVAPHCKAGYPCFNPFVYSFQLLIPGLDLREVSYWLPNAIATRGKLLMVYTWVMIVFGWVAATAVVAGVSQFFRKR